MLSLGATRGGLNPPPFWCDEVYALSCLISIFRRCKKVYTFSSRWISIFRPDEEVYASLSCLISIFRRGEEVYTSSLRWQLHQRQQGRQQPRPTTMTTRTLVARTEDRHAHRNPTNSQPHHTTPSMKTASSVRAGAGVHGTLVISFIIILSTNYGYNSHCPHSPLLKSGVEGGHQSSLPAINPSKKRGFPCHHRTIRSHQVVLLPQIWFFLYIIFNLNIIF